MARHGGRHDDHLDGGFLIFNGLIALTTMAAIYLHLASSELLVSLCLEDGPVEWATAAGFLLAGLLFAAAALRLPQRRLFVLTLSMLCLFVAGEEISWGQRILGLATPELIAANNVQAELNIHNLIGIHGIIRLAGVLFVLSVFVVLPLGARLCAYCDATMRRFGIVVPPLRYCHMAVIAILFQATPRLLGKPIFYFDEVGELLLSLAFLAFATALVRRTIGRESREPGEAKASGWRGVGRTVAGHDPEPHG